MPTDEYLVENLTGLHCQIPILQTSLDSAPTDLFLVPDLVVRVRRRTINPLCRVEPTSRDRKITGKR